MAPPSQLSIATSSVNRLLKEEDSYRAELDDQQSRLQKLEAEVVEDEDGNRAYTIKQQVRSEGAMRAASFPRGG